jgi:hypothetical protein
VKAEPVNGYDEGGEDVDKGTIGDWSSITSITEFTVDKDTLEQVNKFGESSSVAASFLPRAERIYLTEIWDSEAVKPTKLFASLLVNTDKLSNEIDSNHILWLFHMLLWYRVKEILAPGTGHGRIFLMGKN